VHRNFGIGTLAANWPGFAPARWTAFTSALTADALEVSRLVGDIGKALRRAEGKESDDRMLAAMMA
jgi:hypothetical protein